MAVTIFFGANDSALKGTGTCVSLVHLSLFSVKANLTFYTFSDVFVISQEVVLPNLKWVPQVYFHSFLLFFTPDLAEAWVLGRPAVSGV